MFDCLKHNRHKTKSRLCVNGRMTPPMASDDTPLVTDVKGFQRGMLPTAKMGG